MCLQNSGAYAAQGLRCHQQVRGYVCQRSAFDDFRMCLEQEIALEDLQQYPILMLDRKSTTSEFLHNLFLQHQLELMPQIELSSNDLLIDLARIGLGIAFIPDYCLNRESKELFIVKIKEKLPARQMVTAVNPTLPIAQSTEEFLKLLPSLPELG